MAEIASAYLTIIPKFQNLQASIASAMEAAGPGAATAGNRIGNAISRGIRRGTSEAKTHILSMGAAMGTASSMAQRAMDLLGNHISSAVARIDTLKNYPRVMQSLGYSAKEAQKSMSLMDSRLSTLPTRLDDMARTVSGLAVFTGDLDKATRAGLALNDMLLSSGSNQQLVLAATEQFRQMLAKGKPDMQDWKSLVQTMPAQLNQLAKAILGPTANANMLYEALGGGQKGKKGKKAKQEVEAARVSMDQLLDAMIKLDTEGSGSIRSFKDQTASATEGIGTALSNLSNAFTKGLAAIMDAVGQRNISAGLNMLRDQVKGAFNVVASAVRMVMPVFVAGGKGLLRFRSSFKEAGVAITAGVTSFGVLNKIVDIIGRFRVVSLAANKLDALAFVFPKAGGAIKSFVVAVRGLASAHPILLAISAAFAILTPVALAAFDAFKHAEEFKKATKGLNEAVADSSALFRYRDAIEDVGQSAQTNAGNVESLIDATKRHANAIKATNREAADNISTLNAAAQIISDYAGKADVTAEAQGKIAWAVKELNKQLNTNISVQDVMNNKFTDASGKVQELRQSILDLIEAKKRSIIADAQMKNVSELYAKRIEDTKRLKAAQEQYNQALKEAHKDYNTNPYGTGGDISGIVHMSEEEYVRSRMEGSKAKREFDEAKEAVKGTESAINELNQRIGATQSQAQFLAQILKDMGVGDSLKEASVDVDKFAASLEKAGVHSQDLERIGSDGLQNLATACNGNIDQMIAAIQNYNGQEIKTLHGEVIADSTQLVDALGNVYTWNGTELVDKSGTAAVNDTEVVDAQGNVLVWNGTDLMSKDAYASVQSGEVEQATDRAIRYGETPLEDKSAEDSVDSSSVQTSIDRVRERESNPPSDQHATTIIDHITNWITNTVSHFINGNASGGIRPHADGGIRYHAQGAIATSAVPLDIVGEAGAEAIVPLTNRRYSQPFADIIADSVTDKLKRDNEAVHWRSIERLLMQILEKDSNVYLDATKVSGVLDLRSRIALEGRGYAYQRDSALV